MARVRGILLCVVSAIAPTLVFTLRRSAFLLGTLSALLVAKAANAQAPNGSGAPAKTTSAQAPTTSAPTTPSAPTTTADAPDTSADAETPDAESQHPIADELARKHYEDGRNAASKGDWPAAYTSLRAAIAVSEHYLIYGALGETAQKLGKDRDSAEYLTLYLEKAPEAEPQEARNKAAATLTSVKARVGTLTITAPEGAELFVDQIFVGKAPLPRQIFVEPGKREVEAHFENKMAIQKVTLEKGGSSNVALTPNLPLTEARAKLKTTPPKTPLPPLVPKSEPKDSRGDILTAGVVVSAGTAAVGGLLLGIGAAKSADEQALRDELVALKKGNVCLPTDRDSRCDQVKDNGRTADVLASTGSALFGGGIAIGAATLTYFLLTRGEEKPSSKTGSILQRLTVTGHFFPTSKDHQASGGIGVFVRY